VLLPTIAEATLPLG